MDSVVLICRRQGPPRRLGSLRCPNSQVPGRGLSDVLMHCPRRDLSSISWVPTKRDWSHRIMLRTRRNAESHSSRSAYESMYTVSKQVARCSATRLYFLTTDPRPHQAGYHSYVRSMERRARAHQLKHWQLPLKSHIPPVALSNAARTA